MWFFLETFAALAAVLSFTEAISIDTQDAKSLRSASGTLAYGLMSFYQNNRTSTPTTQVGTLPDPLYWWEAGAVWGGMVDYWAYTGDTSYVETVQQGLLAQVGPDNNYMPPAYQASLGNDDQAFWAVATLSALEYNFPVPDGNSSSLWLDLSAAVFNTMVPRWNTSACHGGLAWQIFQSNVNGMDYKNSISNGGFFQIAARLAHNTGNSTYSEWANKIWGWMEGVNLIDNDYNVWDGVSAAQNCSVPNKQAWSYNPSMMLYGAAMMYNATSSSVWRDRTTGLLKTCENSFFSPYPNATDIAYERRCEPQGTCNNDQYSFKAYLARWMAKSAIVAPFIHDSVLTTLNTSAVAGAQTCTGGDNGDLCGQKWYIGGFDGNSGVGQQLSVLETVQALLLLQGDAQPAQMFPAVEQQAKDSNGGGAAQTTAFKQGAAEPGPTPTPTDVVRITKTRTIVTTAKC